MEKKLLQANRIMFFNKHVLTAEYGRKFGSDGGQIMF